MTGCKIMPRIESSSRQRAESPREQAIYWFSRERLGTLDAHARQERDAWLAADPEHQRQYRSVEATWSVADSVPQAEWRAMLERTESEPAAPRRRRFAVGLTAACALMATAGVIGPRLWAPEADFTQALATGKGERHRVVLPDGSLLELNTDTQARVSLYGDRREVELLAGEVLSRKIRLAEDRVRETGSGIARARQRCAKEDGRREGNPIEGRTRQVALGEHGLFEADMVQAGVVQPALVEVRLVYEGLFQPNARQRAAAENRMRHRGRIQHSIL